MILPTMSDYLHQHYRPACFLMEMHCAYVEVGPEQLGFI